MSQTPRKEAEGCGAAAGRPLQPVGREFYYSEVAPHQARRCRGKQSLLPVPKDGRDDTCGCTRRRKAFHRRHHTTHSADATRPGYTAAGSLAQACPELPVRQRKEYGAPRSPCSMPCVVIVWLRMMLDQPPHHETAAAGPSVGKNEQRSIFRHDPTQRSQSMRVNRLREDLILLMTLCLRVAIDGNVCQRAASETVSRPLPNVCMKPAHATGFPVLQYYHISVNDRNERNKRPRRRRKLRCVR